MKKSGISCLFLTCTAILLPSCALLGKFVLPPDYVPDDKVVFLKQKTEYGPIRYEPIGADPYSWKRQPKTDPVSPAFLRSGITFPSVLRPDYPADAVLYTEVRDHLTLMTENSEYLSLLPLLRNEPLPKPLPLHRAVGAKKRDFSNAVEYDYPPLPGSSITVFPNGDYQISLPDGSLFHQKQEGYFFQQDPSGREKFAVFSDQYRATTNGVTFSYFPSSRTVESPKGKLSYHANPVPQHQFVPAGSPATYLFFLNSDDRIKETGLRLPSGLRFDYFPHSGQVLISFRTEAVVIYSNFQKQHTRFDTNENKPEDILSWYFPEGIRAINLDKPHAWSEMNPAWPENYKKTSVGPFSVLFTEPDRRFLSRLDAAKMKKVRDFAVASTGLPASPQSAIILPPGLTNYLRISLRDRPDRFVWYPSGYALKDTIVMWPPSVPRYNAAEGEEYFWTTEFYEILLHEYVHLLVGQSTGIFSRVPVWLNEGLAVHVESAFSPETKKYWETTYRAEHMRSRLLDWDDITEKPTGAFPVEMARVHYAQSWKMTDFLVSRYGMKAVADYLRSFRIPLSGTPASTIVPSYRTRFEKYFGTSWEENLRLFEEHSRTLRAARINP